MRCLIAAAAPLSLTQAVQAGPPAPVVLSPIGPAVVAFAGVPDFSPTRIAAAFAIGRL